MFAVIKTGGKQYRVAAADLIEVEKLGGEAGQDVAFGEVLMVGGDDGTTLGTPLVAGASVAGEIVEQRRGPKVIAFKKRRRHNSKRKSGHRQELTLVRITEILAAGVAPAKRPRAAKAETETGEEAKAAPAKRRRTKAAEGEEKE